MTDIRDRLKPFGLEPFTEREHEIVNAMSDLTGNEFTLNFGVNSPDELPFDEAFARAGSIRLIDDDSNIVFDVNDRNHGAEDVIYAKRVIHAKAGKVNKRRSSPPMGHYLVDHRGSYFEIFPGDDEKSYWRLYRYEDIIATGHQGFDTPEQCEGQIALVVVSADADTEIRYSDE